jgi:hypothetical protein
MEKDMSKEKRNPEPFRCASCGGQFMTTTTAEEVNEEYERLFPDAGDEKRYVVCHDCWVELTQKPPKGMTAQ